MDKDLHKDLFGQIIALFYNLFLNQTDKTIEKTESISQSNFAFGNNKIQVKEIWFTSKTKEHIKIIIKYLNMLDETKSLCKDIPKEELEKLIFFIIDEKAMECNYLDATKIMVENDISLIECRKIDNKIEFAKEFYKDILELLNKKQITWFNLVPLMMIKLESFELDYDGITLIKRVDRKFWNEYEKKYPICSNYNIASFSIKNHSTSLYNDVVIMCKNKGSQEYAKLDAESKIKKFLSILFSFTSIKNNDSFSKSMHKGESWITQLPIQEGINILVSNCKSLLPYYLKCYVSEVDCNQVKEYYKKLEIMNEKMKNRIFVATSFINNAMNSDNSTDIFLNYYIALDALFGVNYKVEKSIEKGINLLISDSILKEKAKLLYKLRSELVHGGSRNIASWDGYENYYYKFKNNDILTDIEKIAFECLNKYPYMIDDSFFEEFN